MQRVFNLPDLIGVGTLGLLAYKAFELGPYEAAILFGRCAHVFIVAMQGYL